MLSEFHLKLETGDFIAPVPSEMENELISK